MPADSTEPRRPHRAPRRPDIPRHTSADAARDEAPRDDTAPGLQPEEAQGGPSGSRAVEALLSLLIPGLGQLMQKRPLAAALYFVACLGLWFILMGWLVAIASAIDAAVWPRRDNA